MEVKWTTNLSVGVEKIDEQHKIWFDKANNLFQAGKNRKSREVIEEMFHFLMNIQKNISAMKKHTWNRKSILVWKSKRQLMQTLSRNWQN